jgi:penicillin-binding protein 1A
MTAAYGAFANQGVYHKPFVIKKIEDHKGQILWQENTPPSRVMSEETAYLMTNMLETSVEDGTGRHARLADRPVAGKTGTTSETKDAWFIGYTPNLVAGVWLGYDTPREMAGVIGGGYNAGPIWRQVMEVAHQGIPALAFPRPENIVEVEIDTKSGLLPSELTPSEYRKIELFHKDHVPTEVSTAWVKADFCFFTSQPKSGGCLITYPKVVLKRSQPWNGQDLPAKMQGIVPEDAGLEVPKETCTMHSPPLI